MSPKLRTFLQYLRTKHPGDDFTERLEERVRQVKTSAKWRLEYMKMELKLYEMHMAGREEGLIEGLEKGEERKLISQIKKKLSAGKDPEQIADEVEEAVEEIQPIVDILREHPEYDVDEVYESLRNEIIRR